MPRRPPLVFIYTVTLTGILSNTLVTPVIPDILEEFDRPDARAGLLVATGSVAGIVVAPIAGFLADRFGRRIVLTTSLGFFGVFGGLAAISPTFEILLLARFLQGVGSASLINLALVLIGDFWTGLDRTRLVGRNSAVLTVPSKASANRLNIRPLGSRRTCGGPKIEPGVWPPKSTLTPPM